MLRKFEELTAEHDNLSVAYATAQKEKQIWMQKEEEYLEIQKLQSRNLEELNATVLQIQEEREGWHRRSEEVAAELRRSQERNNELEQTISQQELLITQLNSSVLTSQEEIMNLTQTLATHLEQIANISKQNKELHATLVSFTRTNDKQFVEEMLPNLSQSFDEVGGISRPGQGPIEVLNPESAMHEAALNASIHPSFNGPTPGRVHSQAFLSPGRQRSPQASPRSSAPAGSVGHSGYVHPSSSAAYNFLHTTSSLSTLHLPASYITSKLSSYILWILEHKQILENMMQRKEKLRKELEEQIVVANVEAQVVASEAQGSPRVNRSLPGSPGSPIRMRSASPPQGPLSPSHMPPLPNSAIPPPTMLLPSMLQHCLHDLHELTHLTRHDELQFQNFEREKVHILKQCSSSGFNKHNGKLTKTAWNLWMTAMQRRAHRKEVLHRVLGKLHLRNCAWAMAIFSTRVMVRFGQRKLLLQCNSMKMKIVSTLLRKAAVTGLAASKLAFVTWAANARKKRRMRLRLCAAVANAAENRIIKLWTRWKATTLKLRHTAAVEQGREDAEAQAAAHRAAQLEKMQKMLTRRLLQGSSMMQRHMFLSWRNWSTARRVRKRHALNRIVHICCGQGMLIKVWSTWKEWRRSSEKAEASTTLALTQRAAAEKYAAAQEHFLVAYTRLRDRYRNFKLMHWWRLAFVDTQWMHRENQWRKALLGQKTLQIRTLVRMHTKCNFLPIFHAWRKITRDHKKGKLKMGQKIFERLISIQKHHAFRRWAEFNEQARVDELKGLLHDSKEKTLEEKRKFVASLVAKWRRQHLSQAFEQFHSNVQARRARKRDLLDRTVRRMQQSQLWAGWRAWVAFVEKSAIGALQSKLVDQKSKFSSVLVQRWRMGCMVPAFAAWREKVAVRKAHRRDVLDRTCKKLVNAQLWRALRTWKSFAESSNIAALKETLSTQIAASKKKRCEDLIKRWRHASLVPAWTQWQDFIAARRRRRRDLLDRTCKRMLHSALWKGFKTWSLYSEKFAIHQMQTRINATAQQAQDQRLRLAEHMLAKWRMTRSKQRFLAWKHYTKDSRAHKRQVLDRTLKHLSSGYLGQGFRAWKAYNEAHRLNEMHQRLNETKAKTAAQAILKWKHRIVTTPFLQWRHHAAASRAHKREVMDRMVRRLTHAEVFKAWRTWVHFLDQTKLAYMRAKFASAKGELTNEIQAQKQARIKALIQRWRGQSLTTRFSQWKIYARTSRAKKKGRLDQIFKRLVFSNLWKGWRTWKTYCELHRAHIAASIAENARVLLVRSHSIKEQSTRTKHILTKTLDRMSNLLLFSGWRGWVEFVGASKANDIAKAKKKLEQQAAQLKEKQAELVRAHAEAQLQSQQKLVDKTLKRIAYSTLYKALRTWKQRAEDLSVWAVQKAMKGKENALKLRILTDKIARHRESSLRPVMQRWRKYTKARKERKRELMDKMIKRMGNLRVWQALRHWKEWTHTAAVDALRAEMNDKLQYQKKARAAALIQKWQHRSLQPTFQAWQTYTRGNHKRKHLLSKVFARLASLQLHRAFRQWKIFREQQIASERLHTRQRVIMDRTFKRMCSTMLYRALRTWRSFADAHKQHQFAVSLRLLRSAAVQSKLASLQRTSAKHVFVEWRRYAKLTRKERGMVQELSAFRKLDVLDRTIRRTTAAGLLKAFLHWRTYILRARLMMNDKLGEYSAQILQLRAHATADSLKLHEFLTENQKLKSSLLSIKHKSATLALLGEKQRENRAILFSYNTTLSRHFRAFYERVHLLKRRKIVLHKALAHVDDSRAMRALSQWRNQTMRHRGAMMSLALESAKKQLDQVLGKVWSLENQLAQRSLESESVAAESQAVLLNAQAQEVNHALERGMPNEREVALAKEVDTLAAKLELLLREVKERGAHIQFLSSENQRLTTIVKSSASMGAGPAVLGVSFPNDLSASTASSIHNNTLNLSSSSFARSRGVGGGVGGGPTPAASTLGRTSTLGATKTTFFPAGNVSFQ